MKSENVDKSNPEVTVNLTPIKISDGYAECDVRLVAGPQKTNEDTVKTG